MYDWPLYIQKNRMVCQPRHVITIKLFSAPSPSFYITVLKVIEKKKNTSFCLKGPLILKRWPEPTPNNALLDTV